MMGDKGLQIKENIIYWVDKGNNTWCFYKGKKYWLERYMPLSVQIDNDIIVYQDLDGRLKGFYYGEQLLLAPARPWLGVRHGHGAVARVG